MMLDAEARLGELLMNTEGCKKGRPKKCSSKGTFLSDMAITRKESHYAQTLAKHIDVVQESKYSS
jgi:hypothetical protein